jgi:hypothetical protein
MRRFVSVCAALAVVTSTFTALGAAPAAAVQTVSFEARFQDFFGRSVPHPFAPPAFFCGFG